MGRLTWSLWIVVMALSIYFRGISAWNNDSLVSSTVDTTLSETERKPSSVQALLHSTEQPSIASFSVVSPTTDRPEELLSSSPSVRFSSSTTDKVSSKSFIAKLKTPLVNSAMSTEISPKENFHAPPSTASLWQIGISSSTAEMFLQVPSSIDLTLQSVTALIKLASNERKILKSSTSTLLSTSTSPHSPLTTSASKLLLFLASSSTSSPPSPLSSSSSSSSSSSLTSSSPLKVLQLPLSSTFPFSSSFSISSSSSSSLSPPPSPSPLPSSSLPSSSTSSPSPSFLSSSLESSSSSSSLTSSSSLKVLQPPLSSTFPFSSSSFISSSSSSSLSPPPSPSPLPSSSLPSSSTSSPSPSSLSSPLESSSSSSPTSPVISSIMILQPPLKPIFPFSSPSSSSSSLLPPPSPSSLALSSLPSPSTSSSPSSPSPLPSLSSSLKSSSRLPSSTVFPHQATAPAMSASVTQETTLSVLYTEKPTSSELPTEFSKTLVAKLTINMTFTRELADPSSKTSKELARELELLLNDVFKDISGFLYVKVKKFEKGSVVCNFMIHMKMESLATAEEFEKVLTAAAKDGKTGKYQISNIEVQDTVGDTVGAVKEKEPEGKSFPATVVGVSVFVGVVALIFVFVLYKVIKRKRREREGHRKTEDVYPLSDFNSNTEVDERKPVLHKKSSTGSIGIEDDDEITPFYKPGYKKNPGPSQYGLLQGHAKTRV